MRRNVILNGEKPTVSASVATKLVDTLFDQYDSIIVGQLGVVAAAGLAYCHGRSLWLLAWMGLLVFILPFRIWLARAYWRRVPSGSPMRWAFAFAVGAGLTSLSYGLASAASVLQPDQFLQVVIITGQGAYVTITAVRNNAVPKVAAVQGVLPLACLAIACFASGQLIYQAYAFLVLVHMICVIQIIRFLSKKTRDLLVAEERATIANARLEELAITDPLTGAANRRGFDTAMAKAVAHADRHQQDLSLLLLDIDHFKALNDAFGHQTGDDCLRAVAFCLNETVRLSDLVARHGGEEFAVLLPATGHIEAERIAERVRIAIQTLAVAHPTSPSGAMTVSVGHATIEHAIAADSGALIKRADAALYRAKGSGRNRIAGDAHERAARSYELATI